MLAGLKLPNLIILENVGVKSPLFVVDFVIP